VTAVIAVDKKKVLSRLLTTTRASEETNVNAYTLKSFGGVRLTYVLSGDTDTMSLNFLMIVQGSAKLKDKIFITPCFVS
jgi:hypothetical protein